MSLWADEYRSYAGIYKRKIMGNWVLSTWRKYRWCVYIFLLWKVITVSLIYTSYWLYHDDSYDYLNLRFYHASPLLPFAFWDGQHYLKLAEVGYLDAPGLSQAFYPLFPFTIRLIHTLVPDLILSGVMASTLFSLIFIISFYRLALLFLDKAQAQRVLVLILLFPTSIFLTVIYTEGLFLFLLCTLLFLYLKKSPWVIIFALLLPLCRGQGIFLILPVIAMLIYQILSRKSGKDIIPGLELFCGLVSGTLLLILFSGHTTGDPFMLFHAQTDYFQFFGVSTSNILNPLHLLHTMTVIKNNWLIPDILCIYLMFMGTYFVVRLKNPLILFCYIVLIYMPAAMGEGWSYIRYALLGIPFVYMGIIRISGLRKWPFALLGWSSAILQLAVIFCWSAKIFIA